MPHKLELKNITYQAPGAGNDYILKDISLQVEEGELIALTGPSGSGKSTLLSVAGSLLTPSAGEILLDAQETGHASPRQKTNWRLHHIGFIFQSAHLLPYLNVIDQLLYPAKLAGVSKQKARQRAEELLALLGMDHRTYHYPVDLSGGEKQRVAIARAWMNKPSLILADEPTASLDQNRGREVIDMLASRIKEERKAGILVTHDTRLFASCDRVISMEDGRILSSS